jgi:hypothetical protein
MHKMKALAVCVVVVVSTMIWTPAAAAQGADVAEPSPDAASVSTIEGLYTVIAYNDVGWVTLGYRGANDRQGGSWLMLETGLTLRQPAEDQTLRRGDFSLELPDGSVAPLPTQEEFLAAYQNGDVPFMPSSADMSSRSDLPTAVLRMQQTTRDDIGFFPPEADQPCVFRFFSGPMTHTTSRTFPDDEFNISFRHACAGYLFFKMPYGEVTVPGQYSLVVDFSGDQVRVPFRIMTGDERKLYRKSAGDLEKGYKAFLEQGTGTAKEQG